jgi:DNA-binding MarR family transcriptional regulator
MQIKDLQNGLAFKLHQVAWGLGKLADKAMQEELKWGFSQFMILAVLKFHPHCSQRTIAEERHLTEAAISRQVEGLMEKGWVVRQENPKNRREHMLELTFEGKEALKQGIAVMKKEIDKVFSVLQNEEKSVINTALDKLIKVIYTKNNA